MITLRHGISLVLQEQLEATFTLFFTEKNAGQSTFCADMKKLQLKWYAHCDHNNSTT